MTRLITRIRRRRDHVQKASDQCQYPTEDKGRLIQWRIDRYLHLRPTFDPLKCQHECHFEIQGLRVCRSHAGKMLLNLAQRGKLVLKGRDDL